MKITRALIAAAAAAGFATSANAAIVLSSVTPGTNPYVGPVTYDFETPAPVSGGVVTNETNAGDHAQPYGSTGNYWSVGPFNNGSGGFLKGKATSKASPQTAVFAKVLYSRFYTSEPDLAERRVPAMYIVCGRLR